MASIGLKECLGRPRVFTVINNSGIESTLRFEARQRVDVDEKLFTPEILKNINKGALLVVSGIVPENLSPYPRKGSETKTEMTPNESSGAQKRVLMPKGAAANTVEGGDPNNG